MSQPVDIIAKRKRDGGNSDNARASSTRFESEGDVGVLCIGINQDAYPAQLQAVLRAKGIDAQVTNAGVPLDTTAMMLRRIDKDVPNGTDITIEAQGTA